MKTKLVNCTRLSALALLLMAHLVTAESISRNAVEINWLGTQMPTHKTPVSFGVPWPRGRFQKDASFTMVDADGQRVPLSTWPLAYWPDGSLKWSGCGVTVSSEAKTPFTIGSGTPKDRRRMSVTKTRDHHQIDTGASVFHIATSGKHLVTRMLVAGNEVARDLSLVAYLKDSPDLAAPHVIQETYHARFTHVELEQKTSVRVVVKAQGSFLDQTHHKERFPFTLRLYFYHGVAQARSVFSFIYDGDQHKDFIAGLGMTVQVPLRESLLNRHVMLAGVEGGLWHEPVRVLTGRTSRWDDETVSAYDNQLLGRPVPDESQLSDKQKTTINELPVWDGFKLQQYTADSFAIHKRTGSHSRWIKADHGDRARGMAFAGDTTGGIAMGLKDFWQTSPSAIDIQGMSTDQATMILWFWSPESPPMDLRHYDIKGHSLEAVYEDYQEGHSTPYGIARTFEVNLQPMPSVPDSHCFDQIASANARPALLVCSPEYYHQVGAFGKWSLRDTSTASRQYLEDKIDTALDFYKNEIEQRKWYGFWDYGDVMHAYDAQRHVWRYDVGGFAWANSELVPDIMLWYAFLRTGCEDVYRMAEAMTRHTQEVDVYHIGPLKGLGSRHNVSHWGGGAKEARIGMAGLKRFYYYLSTDERMGDLLDEVVDADKALLITDPLRRLLPKDEHPTHARVGPDWTSFVANWLAAWERTGDVQYRDRIINGMDSIAAMPRGVFSDEFFGYHPDTQTLHLLDGRTRRVSPSHMIAIFGGAEIMMEIDELIDHPAWQQTWLEFCERYRWSAKEWKEKTSLEGKSGGQGFAYARLTAYAAYRKKDERLATRAWQEFLYARQKGRGVMKGPQQAVKIQGSDMLKPIFEVPGGNVSTNYYSQWCLTAIETLELIGEYLPENIEH